MAKAKKKKTPSRLKYEQNNPVSSSRIDKQLKETLREIKEKEGLSQADVLRRGTGLVEVKMRKEEEIRQQAYDEGEENGIRMAERVYMVTYPCSKCGKMKAVTTDEEKKAIRDFMVQSGWCHADCNDPWNSV